MNDHTLKNRRIRIDLSTNSSSDRRGGFGNRDGGMRGNRGGGGFDDDGDDRTAGDWRSGPPASARDNDRDRDRGYGDRDRDRGYGDRYEPPRDRGGYDRGRISITSFDFSVLDLTLTFAC